MVERAALEMRYTRKRIEGSNPPLSAKKEIKLSVQVYLSKQFYFFCKDAVGRLRGLRSNPSLFDAVGRLRDYVEIPHFWMPSADLGIT